MTMAQTIKETISVGHAEIAAKSAVETKEVVLFSELGIEYKFDDGSFLFISQSGMMEVKDADV